MKLLSIEDGKGLFLGESGKFFPIDKITKEDILRLLNLTLQDSVELDEYEEQALKNHAHQIVYKSLYEKLRDLQKRRQEFKDQSERLFLKEYEKYKADASGKALQHPQ